VKDQSETDQYGRLLRYVFLQDGTFVNQELVENGYAVAVSYPPDTQYDEQFAAAELIARGASAGMWGMPTVTPIPPTSTPLPPTQPPLPTSTQAPLPTSTPVPVPTNTPVPQPTEPPPPAPANVQITYIFYDGVVPRVESDEYAEIGNLGSQAVNLGGWHLNADDAGQDFWFPGFDLQPGQRCRVYTNEIHPETCGFSYGNGQALWANDGECGHLFDANGVEVSTYCY